MKNVFMNWKLYVIAIITGLFMVLADVYFDFIQPKTTFAWSILPQHFSITTYITSFLETVIISYIALVVAYLIIKKFEHSWKFILTTILFNALILVPTIYIAGLINNVLYLTWNTNIITQVLFKSSIIIIAILFIKED